MNDLVRLQDAIAAKRRELVDFAVDLSGDVLVADASEADRGQAALSLLELLAKGRPQRQRVIIDHEVAEPPKALEKPRYVVPAHVAEIAARIEQTGILPEPVLRSEAPRPKVAPKAPTLPLIRWDDANVAKLRDLYLKDPKPSIAELAAAFNTTVSAIQTVLSRRGIVRLAAVSGAAWKNEKRPRDCLCCRRPFVSEGAHNRQCPRCYEENSEMAA